MTRLYEATLTNKFGKFKCEGETIATDEVIKRFLAEKNRELVNVLTYLGLSFDGPYIPNSETFTTEDITAYLVQYKEENDEDWHTIDDMIFDSEEEAYKHIISMMKQDADDSCAGFFTYRIKTVEGV